MRIVTLNANGIRSATTKGFLDWMKRQKADLVCVQEIKAQEADLPKAILAPAKLHAFFHPAEKKGYSGEAIYARKEPDRRAKDAAKVKESLIALVKAGDLTSLFDIAQEAAVRSQVQRSRGYDAGIDFTERQLRALQGHAPDGDPEWV